MSNKDKRCEGCTLYDAPYVEPQLHKDSDLLLVGQNPGKNEVLSGYPFCHKGDSGGLLREYLDPCPLRYSVVNCVGCFTEENKTPNRKIINACTFKLQEAIEYTTPKLIVTLGKPALYAITGESGAILKLNGKILRDGPIPVAVCVHPAYAIYTGRNRAVFEKGLLPALKYFVEEPLLEYKVAQTLPPIEEEVGFDIETSSLHPRNGEIKCFSVSNGEKAVFVEVSDE